ncbi:MAG: FtsX-like permease family protein [Thermoproteota archaeon]
MPVKARILMLVYLLIILFALFSMKVNATPDSLIEVYGRVLNAMDGSPVEGATVLIRDVSDPSINPVPGAGIYITDEKGSYVAASPYIRIGHYYRIYAFRGELPQGPFDYVPSKPLTLKIEEGKSLNISFRLVPAACLILEGDIMYVEATGTAFRTSVSIVDPYTGSPPEVYGADYVSTYWASSDSWFLGLAERVVVIPANKKVYLRADSWFRVGTYLKAFSFLIDNNGEGFSLPQGGMQNVSIWEYPLRRSLEMVRDVHSEVLQKTEDFSRSGFIVFDERQRLEAARQKYLESQGLIYSNPRESWYSMREAYTEILAVDNTLNFMKFAVATEAVRLPIFLSVMAVTLGFFSFEEIRRKFLSTLIFYLLLIFLIFLIYPGVSTFSNEDVRNFVISSLISISITLVIVFLIPRVWREPRVEGEVSLRSVLSIIFSMSKRQVRKRRLRSIFTFLSLCIMVMTFTALTSFGTVYGLKYETTPFTSSKSGFLVRMSNMGNLTFTPISPSDLSVLNETNELSYISPKVESLGDDQALGELLSSSGHLLKFYGILGIDFSNEWRYVDVTNAITGDLPAGGSSEEIVVSSPMADALGISIGDYVNIYVRGINEPIETAKVVGIFSESTIGSLTDLGGGNYLPLRFLKVDDRVTARPCNASDIFLMDWRGLLSLQSKVESLQPSGTLQLAAISRVAFSLREDVDVDLSKLVRRLTFVFGYVVNIVGQNQVETYSLGYFYETKGIGEMIIPIIMVMLNTGSIMLNVVYERHREMKTLTLLGLNPVHIGLIFVAEAIIIGLIGGGIGYVVGLGFQRVIVLFGQDLMVKSKIEWWWSFIGLALSLLVSVLSSWRAAAVAVKIYTPSMVRKVKTGKEEKKIREEEIFRIFQGREVSMPIRLHPVEVDFFTGYVITRLSEMKFGFADRVEDLEEMKPQQFKDGSVHKGVHFKYLNMIKGQLLGTKNRVLCIQDPGKDFFRVSLVYEPTVPGIPEAVVKRVVEIIKDICYSWVKEKDRIVVGFK